MADIDGDGDGDLQQVSDLQCLVSECEWLQRIGAKTVWKYQRKKSGCREERVEKIGLQRQREEEEKRKMEKTREKKKKMNVKEK